MSKGNTVLANKVRYVKTKTILLSKIKFDEKNPNNMSEIHQKALDNTITKYGFAVEPWVNEEKDGTYLVIDGEHRIRFLMENGEKEVQAKVFKVSYTDVQMLRQVANKLRGEHDRKKDAAEYKSIFDAGFLDEFSLLSGESTVNLQKIIETEFNFATEPVDTISELDTEHRCPKCDYTW